MIEIRPIRQEERIELTKVKTIAFLRSRDFSDASDWQKGWETGRAAFLNGQLVACMELIDYTVRFDSHEVGMMGIGGVASLPEARNAGLVRGIFRRSFDEMREKGQVFSWLYPFSFAYYRQYGYELAQTGLKASFPTDLLGVFPRKGQLHMWKPGDDLSDFKRIYDVYAQDHNMSVVRTDEIWGKLFAFDPYKDRKYAYLYHNDSGEATAYILFDILSDSYPRCMRVLQHAYTAPAELLHMLGRLKSLNAQISQVSWDIDEQILSLFPEPCSLNTTLSFPGMNRIVDVKKALSLMALPGGKGQVTLSVTDDFLPDNRGTYLLEWAQGQREITLTDRLPDAVIDIRALAQLIPGFRGFADDLPGVTLMELSARQILCLLFPRKHVRISDFF